MSMRLFAKLSMVIAVLGLAACSAQPDVTRTKAVTTQQSLSLSNLSRQFMAQTPYTVNFEFDKDNLDARAQSELGIQADWILDHPNVRFSVYGHTDKVGSQSYNHDLGMRRAVRAMEFLIDKGIDPQRLEALVTHGEDLPMVETELRNRKNRRATTVVMGHYEPDPDVVEPASRTQGRDFRPAITISKVTEMEPTDTKTPSDPLKKPKKPKKPSDPDPKEPTGDDGPDGDGGDDPKDDDQDDGGQGAKPNTNTGKHDNAGRGNGDEDGDPGKSAGKNKGGDEEDTGSSKPKAGGGRST